MRAVSITRRYGVLVVVVMAWTVAVSVAAESVDGGFYEAAAQVIPVLLLVVAVEAQLSAPGPRMTPRLQRRLNS
jgi:hypothetical protein